MGSVCLIVIAVLVAIGVGGFGAAAGLRAAAVAMLLVALHVPREADAQVTFTVDSTRSGMWVGAEVRAGFATATDRDSTGLSGTFSIQVEDQAVRVTSGMLHFADSLFLDFIFGDPPYGSVTVETEPALSSLELVVAGPKAALIGGAFTQRANILLFESVLHMAGHGVFANQVPADPLEIALGSSMSLSGTLHLEDLTYELVLPIRFTGTFDLGNGEATVTMDGTVYATGMASVAAEDPLELPPAELVVSGLYPQPVRTRALVGVSLARAEEVRVEVFDVRGRRVAEPVEAFLGMGRSEVAVDASRLSSGLYVVVVTGGTSRETVLMVVNR